MAIVGAASEVKGVALEHVIDADALTKLVLVK